MVGEQASESEERRRQRAEQALRKSEERFRQVVESAPNAIVMANDRGLIEMVNAQTERLFGYGRAELLGHPVEMLVPERFRAHHPQMRHSYFAEPRSRPMGAGRDLYGLRKDGTEFPVEIGLNPIETEEGMMVLSAIVDISDRKQKEERIHSALKEKDILLQEIHHRVKNNLQIVYSLLDMQSARVTDPIAIEMLRDSQSRIQSMALIHQTLYQSNDFAKVDFSSFLDTLVPTLIASYEHSPGQISVSINTVETFLPISSAIPCGLLVNELVSNALKHAFPDHRRGEIAIDLANASEDMITLTVSDGGVGIPDHVDATQTDTLGLQLVMHLVEQLKGEMTIHRANPTRFQLRFPIHRPNGAV